MERREFLQFSMFSGGYLLTQGLVHKAVPFWGNLCLDDPKPRNLGALIPQAANNTQQTFLAIPEGFAYNVFGEVNSKMSDDNPTPAKHDGMATFLHRDKIYLVRNHEIRDDPGRCIGDAAKSYDATAGGGTTTLIVKPQTRELEHAWVSLSGTLVNCAGGPTPWGTWISCEETVLGAKNGGFSTEHGYCFEVNPFAQSLEAAVPLKAMGRMIHEAIAVDPHTGIVYLTEDNYSAGFYRFLPAMPGKLMEGGKLEMLAVKDKPQYDTRSQQQVGKVLECYWVPIQDPDPKEVKEDGMNVFQQGYAQNAAVFARLEGCCWAGDSIAFSSTNGGDAQLGQIWRYAPRDSQSGKLTLIFESKDKQILQRPDNLCASPTGQVVICEDCAQTQYLRMLNAKGQLMNLATNVHYDSEFAGATFSPDGKTLFFNIQDAGLTIAMWGPWDKLNE